MIIIGNTVMAARAKKSDANIAVRYSVDIIMPRSISVDTRHNRNYSLTGWWLAKDAVITDCAETAARFNIYGGAFASIILIPDDAPHYNAA